MTRLPSVNTALPLANSLSNLFGELERERAAELLGTVWNPAPDDMDPDRFGIDPPPPVKTLPEHSVVVVQLFDRVFIWQCCQCGDTGRARCFDEAVERADARGHWDEFPAVGL